jgi:hypothetical protein
MHPTSFFKMQKEENEQKEGELKAKKDAEEEWEKSTSIRGFFGPINKNKRLDNLTQASMSDFTQSKKWQPQSDQQLEFDTVITLGLALANLPFAMIENEGFKLILNYLCPRANLKSPSTLSKHKLPMIYKNLRKEVKATIEKDIPSCDMVALTTDGWTARNGDPFVSLTLHYVDAMYELKKLTLDCQNFVGRHTGSLLGQGLDHMVARFPALTRDNLHKVCVMDAAANMKKAIVDSVQIDDHLTCVDHILNTCLTKTVEKCDELSAIIKKCKGLAQRTHQSSLDWQDIQKACESINVAPVKIIQPVVTRWNSNCMMLASILKIKEGLVVASETLDKPDLQALIPNEREFSIMKKVVPFLEKCKAYSDKWSSEKKVTVHEVQQDILTLHLHAKKWPQLNKEKHAYLNF